MRQDGPAAIPYAQERPRRELRSPAVTAVPAHPNTSPPEPSGPRYSARVALSCKRGDAPGQVLHALQELRQVIETGCAPTSGAGMTGTAHDPSALTS